MTHIKRLKWKWRFDGPMSGRKFNIRTCRRLWFLVCSVYLSAISYFALYEGWVFYTMRLLHGFYTYINGYFCCLFVLSLCFHKFPWYLYCFVFDSFLSKWIITYYWLCFLLAVVKLGRIEMHHLIFQTCYFPTVYDCSILYYQYYY